MRSACMPAIHPRNHERGGPLRAGFPTRCLEPPVGKRLRAHGAITPAPAIQARAALKEFQRSQTAVIELLMECRQLDLNRIRFPNPFVPGLRFTVGAGFLLIAATCGNFESMTSQRLTIALLLSTLPLAAYDFARLAARWRFRMTVVHHGRPIYTRLRLTFSATGSFAV